MKFIFAGVKDQLLGDLGLYGAGAVGVEIDAHSFSKGSPAHSLVIATGTGFEPPWNAVGGLQKEKYMPSVAQPRADMVFFETPKGGAMFSVGSISYIAALCHNNYDNNISRITQNVLERFVIKNRSRCLK